jgi:hypothetical protein
MNPRAFKFITGTYRMGNALVTIEALDTHATKVRVNRIEVDAGYHHTGVFTYVMEYLAFWAKMRGIELFLSVEVDAGSKPAEAGMRRVLRAFGFKQIIHDTTPSATDWSLPIVDKLYRLEHVSQPQIGHSYVTSYGRQVVVMEWFYNVDGEERLLVLESYIPESSQFATRRGSTAPYQRIMTVDGYFIHHNGRWNEYLMYPSMYGGEFDPLPVKLSHLLSN